jgi:hypothetical protein
LKYWIIILLFSVASLQAEKPKLRGNVDYTSTSVDRWTNEVEISYRKVLYVPSHERWLVALNNLFLINYDMMDYTCKTKALTTIIVEF